MGNASVTSAQHEKVEIMSQNTSIPGSHGGNGKEKLTAEQLRKRGNELHDMRRYQEAIECYTRAIMKDASVPTYYTNRALCYLRMQRWDLVCKDCNMAVERDSSCLKAYYFMGVAMMEKNNYDEALNLLHKANELAVKQRQCFGDEITSMIRLCRKRRWNRQEEKRMQQEIDLQIYLHKLMEDEKQRQIDQILASYVPPTSVSTGAVSTGRLNMETGGALVSLIANGDGPSVADGHKPGLATLAQEEEVSGSEPGFSGLDSPEAGDTLEDGTPSALNAPDFAGNDAGPSTIPAPSSNHMPRNLSANIERRIAEIERFHDDKKADFDRMLVEVDDRRKKRDVPDYLCGKISFELMRDPVITPSGITYDRRDIDEHLKRVGHFDPVTRMELTQDLLIPNLAMKEVVDHFLSLNEWAIDY